MKCIYSIYHIVTLIGQVVMICLSFLYVFNYEVTLMSVNHIVYYVTGLIAAMYLIKLAQNWPKLMKMAQETEQSLVMLKISNYTIKKSYLTAYIIMILAGDPGPDCNVIISAFILVKNLTVLYLLCCQRCLYSFHVPSFSFESFSALWEAYIVEHVLWVMYYAKLINECLHNPDVYIQFKENFMRRMPYVFTYVPYNLFNAIVAEFSNFQATFMWSFTDVMIISFSIYITSYFHSLNKIIHSKKENNTYSWGQLRESYSKLAVLVKEIDNQLSAFILLSFFSDQFFICLQLYNSLHPNYSNIKNCTAEISRNVLSSPEYLTYYLSSFLFLVLRAVSLALYAANVHTAAQEPIIPVYDIQSSEYDQEVQRFQLQLRFTEVTLSGKFFHVTRNMVLKAIGSIITYELVLLQFSITPHHAPPEINNITATTEAN